MGCCCNDNNSEDDLEMPEGTEPCCAVRGKQCMCLPYDDGFLVTAQILSILSTFFAWIWWPTWILNFLGLVSFQLLWCLRQNKTGIYINAGVAFLCAMAQISVGIFCLVNWRNRLECVPLIFHTWGIKYTETELEWCREKLWGSLAIGCGALWLAAGICVLYFGWSGRHAKWEEFHANKSAGNNTNNSNTNNNNTSNAAAAVVVELASPPESDDKQDDIES